MKCIILAAGYATRLYPLTENMPKSLLQIGDRTMIDHILGAINKVKEIDKVYLVTNSRFASQFEDWAKTAQTDKEIIVYDDGTSDNATRLGAIGDLQLVIDKAGIDDDTLVLAGDNLFTFSLNDMVAYFNEKKANVITVRVIEELEEQRRMGIVLTDSDMKVLDFEEKPQNPKSNLASPALYLYQKKDIPLIKKYLTDGNNPDAPGHLVSYMANNSTVYAFKFDGIWFDIGTHKSLEEVNEGIKNGDISFEN